MQKGILCILATMLLSGVLWAENDLKQKLNLGESWFKGYSKEALEGRVVVVELWGIN